MRPKDAVLYALIKQDYMPRRSTKLTASEREQTVIIYPELKITGRVTDAKTGEPVPKFRVVKGWRSNWQDRIEWSENMAVAVVGGRYTASFDEPRESLFVKVEAPGYMPAHSRAFGPMRARRPSTSSSNPTPDSRVSSFCRMASPRRAEVAVITWRSSVRLRSGRFEHDADFPTVTTGPDGQFTFPSQAGEFLLIGAQRCRVCGRLVHRAEEIE